MPEIKVVIRVCKIKTSPILKGCFMKGKIITISNNNIVLNIISISSLFKILVLEISDGYKSLIDALKINI